MLVQALYITYLWAGDSALRTADTAQLFLGASFNEQQPVVDEVAESHTWVKVHIC